MTALMLYALQFCKSLQNVFAPLSVAHFDGKRKKKKERKITIKRFAVGWIHFVVFYFLLQRTWRTFQKHFSLATRMRQEFFPSIFSLDFFSHFYAAPKLTVNFLLAAPHSPKIQFSMRESHSLFRPKWLSLTRWQHQLHANFVIIRIAFALCNWNATFGRLYAVGK